MRTTINLDDELIRSAKRVAVEQRRTLTSVLDEALRDYLAAQARPREPYRLALLIKRGRLLPGVDLADRDALYDRMEGRT